MIASRYLSVLVGFLAFFVLGEVAVADGIVKRTIRPNPSNGRWIDTWATMPQLTEPANLPPAPFNQSGAVFVNSTIRQTIRVSVGASQIRLKISNAFGVTNLPITAVTIALPINQTAGVYQIQTSTLQKVTFSGSDSISIPNGALAVSDPLNFKVKPESILAITIYLQDGQTTNSITSHPGSRTNSYWQYGNAVNTAELAITNTATQTAAHWYFISALEAWVPPSYGSLVIIGDSITDGRGSDTNKNNRWPDLLLNRLQKSPITNRIGVANLAAGGNRILADGLGPNALGRIDRDLLAHPGVKYGMIFEGVNDIGTADSTSAVQDAVYTALIQAYKQIVTRVHSFGIPMFAATITPFSAPSNFTGQPYSTPEREVTRQKVNKFIRQSGIFDAVVDFDKMLADPKVPSQLAAEYNSGDYLHPSVKGYQRIADLFPVGVFGAWEGGADEFV
ncbi:SGNH hydrolase-type esterase domain-containing protein [Lophiotrema nucula]|uniref:SGNH hydrolase-type esterase domain-containing protein n=1 Tax=Lophiotrema nucula TaxID=690887 RepID=A0A6A5YG47_9PLEO|nr:SGNH hydrolase-type esterase domain-containing protein [Lophiotrema nucula]